MCSRSPKLDDPAFRERMVVPGHPGLPLSAHGLLLDYRNEWYAALTTTLGVARSDDDLRTWLDRIASGDRHFLRFADRYPRELYLDLPNRQDTEDIAVLDRIVDEVNRVVVLERQTITRDKLRACLNAANDVFAKYLPDAV